MNVKVVKCSCKNEEQDKIYGQSNRVYNPTSKSYPDGNRVYRCTVCEREVKLNEK